MPTRTGFFALALSVSLLGCGKETKEDSDCPDDGTKTPAGEEFSAQYAVAYCDLRKDCYPDSFDEEFGSVETCQKAVSKREIQQECGGCELDVEEADNCVSAAETISCTDWVDDDALDAACEARWDCSE